MADTEMERAFGTLAGAFTQTEQDITQEISTVEQQIEQLKERIIELNGKQETLAHDRAAIEEMYSRYTNGDGAAPAVEF